jgi:hypothetical protein
MRRLAGCWDRLPRALGNAGNERDDPARGAIDDHQLIADQEILIAVVAAERIGGGARVQTLAAGLSIYVTGLETDGEDRSPMMFGEMGGMPAASRLPN